MSVILAAGLDANNVRSAFAAGKLLQHGRSPHRLLFFSGWGADLLAACIGHSPESLGTALSIAVAVAVTAANEQWVVATFQDKTRSPVRSALPIAVKLPIRANATAFEGEIQRLQVGTVLRTVPLQWDA